jgi:hypothetical protein
LTIRARPRRCRLAVVPKQEIRIIAIMSSVEAGQYAESFKTVIEGAGWTVDASTRECSQAFLLVFG